MIRRLCSTILLLLLLPAGVSAAPQLPRGALAGELVLRLRPGAALSIAARASGPHADGLNAILRGAGARLARPIGGDSDTYRVRVGPAASAIAPRISHSTT